jgi:hypothetical protein
MIEITPLHTPEWQRDGADWIMIVGNRVMAVLVPNSCDLFPQFHWLSCFVGGDNEYPDYGWDNVDFETLESAKNDIEQWWWHMVRGVKYDPQRSY